MSRATETLAVATLLGLFLALSGTAALRQSPTVDEFAHLPAGYHYLRTGDFSRYAKNPPLVKMLAAAPLLALRPPVEDGRVAEPSGWEPWLAGTDFMRRNAGRYHRIFVTGRLVVLALGAALGLGIWGAARSLYGPGGGLAALLLYCLSPDFLAHAALATTDIGAALAILGAIWLFLGCLGRPSPWRAAAAGAVFGLALLSKFTALLLAPVFLVALGAAWWSSRRRPVAGCSVPRGSGLVAGSLVFSAASLLVLAGGYGFQVPLEPLGLRAWSSGPLSWLAAQLPGLRLPLPTDFLRGLDAQWSEVRRYGFPNYLLGSWYEGGRWYYFPLAVLLKTPLPILAAVVAGVGLWRRPPGGGRAFAAKEAGLLAVGAWLAAGTAWNNQIQTGVRYLLPAYAVAYVVAGRVGARELLARGGRWYRALLACGVLVLGAGTLRVHPHYLSYCNALAGGTENGYRVLLDSNYDWGQDLPALADYLREHGEQRVRLAYFGPVDPALYGIRSEPLARDPAPGLTAISAATLMGFDFPVMYTEPWQHPPLELAAAYRERRPVGRAGYSILLYRD